MLGEPRTYSGVKVLDRDGIGYTREPFPWPERKPEPNAWIAGPDGEWFPIGVVEDFVLHVKIDTVPFQRALARLTEQFAYLGAAAAGVTGSFGRMLALAAIDEEKRAAHERLARFMLGDVVEVKGTLSGVDAERLWTLFSGGPYFGPRQIRRGQWAAVALVLLGALSVLLVGLS